MSEFTRNEQETSGEAGFFDGPESTVIREMMNELKRLRKSRKIGQHSIAKVLGISQGRVSQMENLRGNMTLEAVVLYAKTVGASIVVVPKEPGDDGEA